MILLRVINIRPLFPSGIISLFAFVFQACLWPAPCYAQPKYAAIQLEIPGSPIFYGFGGTGGLSRDGAVAGYRRISPDLTLPIDQAVVWNDAGIHTLLPVNASYAQATAFGFAMGDNPVGGISLNLGELIRPVIWEPSGPRFLESPTGFGGALSGSKNYIAGCTLGGGLAASYWDAAGFHAIGGLIGRDSQAFSINNAGFYVGPSNHPTQGRAGFIGQNGTSKLLVHPNFPNTLAFDINDSNWVAGEYRPTDSQRAFVWHDDTFIDLGLFPGYNAAKAYAINNDNTLVGGASNYGGDVERALVWFNGSLTPQDLNEFVDIPGATLINGLDVNNAGQIFAEARLDASAGGGYAYYVLTPIPEPACLALVVMAVAGSMNRPRRGG